MALGPIIDFTEIPFLSKEDLSGRFLCTTSFYDGSWHTWLAVDDDGRKLVEVKAWPAEAIYFAAAPEQPHDVSIAFLTFIAQHANWNAFYPPFSAIQDDIFNLSASLAKLDLVFANGDTAGSGATRMAATEVEYILLVCRSMFDLLQELVAKIWDTIKLTDSTVKKRKLKKTFSDMTLLGNQLRTSAQIGEPYGLPQNIADCYARHGPVFLKLRQFRDNLVHRGYQVQTIFRGDGAFVIRKRLGPFVDLEIWRDDEVQESGLVPLVPALNMLIHGTLAACEDFAHTLTGCVRFPSAMVPEMALFIRGYFNEGLVSAMNDANARVAEGRSLVGSTAGEPQG
jgi:hypothetical protein